MEDVPLSTGGPLLGGGGPSVADLSTPASGRTQSFHGLGGGKVLRPRRHTQRAQNPYSRPATGRYAAAGPVAAGTITGSAAAAKEEPAAGSQGDPMTNHMDSSHAGKKGWFFGVGSSISNFITWSWGHQSSVPAASTHREPASDDPSAADGGQEDGPDGARAAPGGTSPGMAGTEAAEPDSAREMEAGPGQSEQPLPRALEQFLRQQKTQGLSLTSDQFSRVIEMLRENVVDPPDGRPSSQAAGTAGWVSPPARAARQQRTSELPVHTPVPAGKAPMSPDLDANVSWEEGALFGRAVVPDTFFTPPGVSEGDGDSPVELARIFMGRPPSPAVRSALTPALLAEGPRVGFVDLPAREFGGGYGDSPRRLLEVRQATPYTANRRRSILGPQPARATPYQRPSQWTDGFAPSQALTKWTPIQAPLTGGRELLKRRRTMLDDGWASVGPLRRTRLRSTGGTMAGASAGATPRPLAVQSLLLAAPSQSTPAQEAEAPSAELGGGPVNHVASAARHKGEDWGDLRKQAEPLSNRDAGVGKLPSASVPFGSVPMQSSETARRILEALDRLSPARAADAAGGEGRDLPSSMRLGGVSERSRRSMLTPEPPPPLHSLEGGDNGRAHASPNEDSRAGPPGLHLPSSAAQFRAAGKAMEQAVGPILKGKGKEIGTGEPGTADEGGPTQAASGGAKLAAGGALKVGAPGTGSQPSWGSSAAAGASPSSGGFRMSAIEDDRDGEPEEFGGPAAAGVSSHESLLGTGAAPAASLVAATSAGAGAGGSAGPPLISVPPPGGRSDAKPFSFVAPPLAADNAATPKLRAPLMQGGNGPGSGTAPAPAPAAGPTFRFTSEQGLPSFADLPGAAERSAHVKDVPSFTFQSNSTTPSLSFSSAATPLAGSSATNPAAVTPAQPAGMPLLPAASDSGLGASLSAKPLNGGASLPPLFAFSTAAAAASTGKAADGPQAAQGGALKPAAPLGASLPTAAVASFFDAFKSPPASAAASAAPGSLSSPPTTTVDADTKSSSGQSEKPTPTNSFFGAFSAGAASQGSGTVEVARPAGPVFGGAAASPFGSPTGASPRPMFPPLSSSSLFQLPAASVPASEGTSGALGQKRANEDSENPSKRRSPAAAPAGSSFFGGTNGNASGAAMAAPTSPVFGAALGGQPSALKETGSALAVGTSAGSAAFGSAANASLPAPAAGLFGNPSPGASSTQPLFASGTSPAFASFGASSAPVFGAGFSSAASVPSLFNAPSAAAQSLFGSSSTAPLFSSFGASSAAAAPSSSGALPVFGASSAAAAPGSPTPFTFGASSGAAQTAPLQAAAFSFGGAGSSSPAPAASAPAFTFGGGASGGGFMFSAGQSSAGAQSSAFTFTASQPASSGEAPAFGQAGPVFGLARNTSLASDGSPNTMEDSMGEEPLSPPKAAQSQEPRLVFGASPPAGANPFVFGQPPAAGGQGTPSTAGPPVFSFQSQAALPQGQPQGFFGQPAATGNPPFGAAPAAGAPASLFNAGAAPTAFSMGAGDAATNPSGRRIYKARRPSGAARKR